MTIRFYQRLHDSIISKAKLRGQDKSKFPELDLERHHVLPTALGGANTPDNKVLLTFREHFAVHFLLTKTLSGQALHAMRGAMAALAMDCTGKRCINATQLAVARKQTSIRMTETQLARSAAGEHAWQTEEYRAGRSAAMTEMNKANNPGKKPENRAASAERMQREFACEHCGDTVKGTTNYKTHHHGNCKFRTHSIIVTRLSDSKRFIFGSKSAAYEFTKASKLDACLLGSRSSSKGYTFAYVLKEQVASQMQLSGISIVTEAATAKPLVVCKHCGVARVASGAMLRHHFKNCASKTR